MELRRAISLECCCAKRCIRAQFDLSSADTGVATASNMPAHNIHDALICRSSEVVPATATSVHLGRSAPHPLFHPIATERRTSLAAESRQPYSMIVLARSKNDSAILRSSALAVLRLITSSNFVGCSTGSSAGLAPCNILATTTAQRRNKSSSSAP